MYMLLFAKGPPTFFNFWLTITGQAAGREDTELKHSTSCTDDM